MHTNALSDSTSPYLRQHQHNPVEWMPWGKDAWAKARAENKLVIVSVGYSTCHWCHVMEHETFENDEAAAFMNAHFVSIKVDREERPDVDQVYMDAVQLMTRRGGWPLNCVALPDGRPIWGGTYFPTERWLSGLGAVREVWQEDADKVEAYAEQLATAVGAMDDGAVAMSASADDDLAKQVDRQLAEGLSRWQATWDMTHGGSQGAPKFPLPCQVSFWLRLAQAKGPEWTSEWSSAGRDHALRTLGGMERGGIHDQVGGGFARYSVDDRWHVPHFEKMLYDNGQLLEALAEATSLSDQPEPALEAAAEGIVSFLLRELDDASGGFKSALDADSDGAEGLYYVWRKADVAAALPDASMQQDIQTVFDLDGRSFWEQGMNVLRRSAEGDASLWVNAARIVRIQDALQQMSEWRDSPASGRSKPGLDDKVLTSWTALAVSGLAKAGRWMGRPEWVDRAVQGAIFLKDVARVPGAPHQLRRTWHPDGGPTLEGFAEDYAMTIDAMLDVHQATLDSVWRDEARALMATAFDRFWDEEAGTFWFTAHDGEKLFAAKQSTDDSVLPSANATLASCLWRLGWAADIPAWRKLGRDLTARHLLGTPHMERAARWASNWLDMRGTYAHIVVAAPSREAAVEAMAEWWGQVRPGTWVDGVWPEAANIPGWMEAKRPSATDPVRWYVCVDGACGRPCATANDAWTQFNSFTL